MGQDGDRPSAEKEINEKRQVLFPISLVPYEVVRAWKFASTLIPGKIRPRRSGNNSFLISTAGRTIFSIRNNLSWCFGRDSDHTDTAYLVGAVGWPNTGIPGRALEIALPPTTAFTFLQKVLFDDILTNTMVQGNKPVIGYISIRICPPTKTLMGMQQFSPLCVMIEVVGYRSPESNVLMDLIQQKVLDPSLKRVDAMLHWGLENDQMTGADLSRMPVNQPLHLGSTVTRLSAFQMVRSLLIHGHAPSPFENNFVTRLNL